jgi:hypothetical protein
LFVAGDAAATASNLLRHEALFRFAFALELISTAASIGIAAFFYVLFKPVSLSLALLAAFFRLVACAVAAIGYVFQLAPLQLLDGGHRFAPIAPDQLQGLALVFSSLGGPVSRISIVFFGFHFLLIGFLIVRSGLLPRALGILVALAGLAALMFLAPQFAAHFFVYFAGIGLLAEVSLAGWLLTAQIDVERWNALAAASAL